MPEVTVTYMVDGQPAMTVADAALALGLTHGRVLQLVTAGTLVPCARAPGPGGKKWLFWPHDIDAIVESRRKR